MKVHGPNAVPPIPAAVPVRNVGSSQESSSLQVVEAEVETDETGFAGINGGDLVSGVKQMPDVRQQRVEALRAAIRSGRYRVSDRQIADALYAKLLASLTQ